MKARLPDLRISNFGREQGLLNLQQRRHVDDARPHLLLG